jgi:hypothetical protein
MERGRNQTNKTLSMTMERVGAKRRGEVPG